MRRTDWRAPALVLVLAALIGFGAVLGLAASHVLATPLDRPVLAFVVRNRTRWLTSSMLAVTNLGAPAFLLFLVGGLGWASWRWRRASLPLVMLAGAWLGGEVLFNVVKLIVDRPRPPDSSAVQHFAGLAFPSGHATQAAAVWGVAAAVAVLTVNTRAAKTAACTAAMAIALVVGVTRVYLGAHWTSDVLGGWALGGLWAAAVIWLIGPRASLHPDVPSVDTTV